MPGLPTHQSTSCWSCTDSESPNERVALPCTRVRSDNLPKTYDSIDREPLCEALTTRFGVLPKMLAAICGFHEGMRARVRKGGKHSELVGTIQGPPQRCVVSPSVFNAPFASAIHVVLVHPGEAEGFLRDTVCLQANEMSWDKESPSRGIRALCSVAYVFDAGLS